MAKKKTAHKDSRQSNARNVIANSQFIDIELMRCDCVQMLHDEELPHQLENNIEVEGKFIKEHRMIVMLHAMQLVGAYKSKPNPEHPPLIIGAVFRARYQLTREFTISEGELAAFGQTVSMFHVWPFWREFTQSITTRMGLPPLTVPLFRLPGFGGDKPDAPKRSRRKTKKKG